MCHYSQSEIDQCDEGRADIKHPLDHSPRKHTYKGYTHKHFPADIGEIPAFLKEDLTYASNPAIFPVSFKLDHF